jgi:hypothetical protein
MAIGDANGLKARCSCRLRRVILISGLDPDPSHNSVFALRRLACYHLSGDRPSTRNEIEQVVAALSSDQANY